MKQRSEIQRAIVRTKRNIANLSRQTQDLLSQKGELMRDLKALNDEMERRQSDLMGRMESLDVALEMQVKKEEFAKGELAALEGLLGDDEEE